jgi:cell division protein FtsB
MSRKRKKKYQGVDFAPGNIVRRLKLESTKKRRGLIKALVLIIAAVVGVKLAVGPFGTLELIRMHQKKCILEDKIKMLSADLTNLEWQVRQLSNPLYIEKLAREKYWMIKPGEIIIKLPAQQERQNDPS